LQFRALGRAGLQIAQENVLFFTISRNAEAVVITVVVALWDAIDLLNQLLASRAV
jgi:hypothetical protein